MRRLTLRVAAHLSPHARISGLADVDGAHLADVDGAHLAEMLTVNAKREPFRGHGLERGGF